MNAIGSALVIGAGPAGASCASWLAQQGIASTLIEQAPQPAPLLSRLDLRQNWVLGFPDTSTAELARRFRDHLAGMELVHLRCGASVIDAEVLSDARKVLQLSDGSVATGAALVFATGLRPRRLALTAALGRQPHDAITLTAERATWHAGRVLLLGAGDNAVENALYLLQRGNSVVLWSRSGLRAQPALQRRLAQDGRADLRLSSPLPRSIQPTAAGWRVSSETRGTESFDQVAVLFGFEPNDDAWQRLRASRPWQAAGWPDVPLSSAAELSPRGVFLCGDVSQRLHPSVQTALAEGVTTSKQVLQWITNQPPTR